MSAIGVYRFSSSPLFRWISCRRSSSKLFVGGISSPFLKISVNLFAYVGLPPVPSYFQHSDLYLTLCFSNIGSSICMHTGLSYDTHEPVLKDVFGKHGELIEVKVICDHKSGKSKGYGFVHFVSEDSATKALAEIDGQLLDGRNIRIHYANKK